MNRKSFIALWTIVAAGVLTGGCDSMISKQVVFKTLDYEQKVSLLNNRRKPNCKIDIELDYATVPQKAARKINAEIIRLIFGYEQLTPRAAVDSFARNYIRSYKEELLPLYRTEQQNNRVTPDWYNYSYTVKGERRNSKAGFACYEIEIERNEGGTESIIEVHNMAFDNETGERIRLADVFVPGSEAALNTLLFQALLEECQCTTKEELQEEGVLLITDMYATENFRLGRREMKFIYSPSEIASYERGTIELTVPYFELQHLLTPKFK